MVPNIESYGFGHIVIDGQSYRSDVIVYPDHVKSRWWRKSGHTLIVEDIQDVLELKPEVLVVGTGAIGLMRVPEDTRQQIQKHGIELVCERTGAAVETYNRLAPTLEVVAALHLTC
jgi:hypothetical protein